MRPQNSKDGFGYDLDSALKQGNIFERVFHHIRISPWLEKIDYQKKTVLDIGCNTGILLIPLLEMGVDVVGVDISQTDIRKAKCKMRELGFPANRALVADAKKLPFQNSMFDIVLLSDILEHAENPDLIASEALRVVKPGGEIYATVPNEWHPVVMFPWLRKILSGRDTVDEHPDIPYNFEKLTGLFPGAIVEEKKLAGFWVQIFCRFRKP